MNAVADTLFEYLRNSIYDPANAVLDIEKLPEDFRDLGEGLRYFTACVEEAKTLAQALSKGDLSDNKIASPGNEIASPLKSLHASLKHLTWQAQQIAQGDYQQRVEFMGDFAKAFNTMTQQLGERHKANIKEKSRLQQYINLLLFNVPEIILVFDTERKAVLASESYKRCSKMSSPEDIEGKSFAQLFAPVSTENFLRSMDELFDEVLVSKRAFKIEQNIDFGQDGNLRAYIIHVTPMLYENETVMGTMIVLYDTTEIIEARQEAERARELAEKSTRAKSEFLARMTHEMRTPMNAVMGMTSIGKSATDIEKKDYSFGKIEAASAHLLGVINDILDMAKIEADKLELSFHEFHFKDMLSHVTNMIGVQAAEKEQNLKIDIDGDIPANIISDEQRLAQVITNLLSNAVKFTPKHGSITLAAKKTAETADSCTIRFTVNDTGIGMSKKQQKLLFIPFEQADGSISRKFGGTGLGLSISKKIIEMMGGNIWVESKPGQGSSFTFYVKAKKPADPKPSKEKNPESVPVSGIFEGKRILVAEDVDINREIIAALLEDTSIEIEFANDGAEAVKKFLAGPGKYRLIFMDIQMPGMDGYEASRRIRSSGLPEAGQIPIIAMTANVFREDVERCLAAGMDGHLGKPVDISEIIAMLKQYIL